MKHSASRGHRENDEYMRTFEAGLWAHGLTSDRGEADPQPSLNDARVVHAALRWSPRNSSDCSTGDKRSSPTSSDWRNGPVNPAGELLDLSDRPIIAGDVGIAHVVLGCSDHAGYIVDADGARLEATLYGKTVGHTEWITGVCVLADASGRTATCAMDGRVLVWGSRISSSASRTSRGRGHSSSARGSRSATSSSTSRAKSWTGSAPTELLGHFGSVSLVTAPPHLHPSLVPVFGAIVVSAGYDKTLRVWQLPQAGAAPSATAALARSASSSAGSSRPARSSPLDPCISVLRGHAAPILCCAIKPPTGAGESSLIFASGDRDGGVRVWSVGPASSSPTWAAACIGELSGHTGHATAVAWVPLVDAGEEGRMRAASSSSAEPLSPARAWALLSGGQDGYLRVWKHAASNAPQSSEPSAAATAGGWVCAYAIPAHATPGGTGAVTDIAVALGSSPPHVVTAGADKALCVLDPDAGFAIRHRITTHSDFIYSLALHGTLSLSGGGDGTLVCHDFLSGKPLWGLGANAAAVRVIAVACGGTRLVVAGDDGKALIYDFSEPFRM